MLPCYIIIYLYLSIYLSIYLYLYIYIYIYIYIYQNKLDKSSFQHDMAYGYFKDLARRTASDKMLRDEAFNITKNPIYDGYQRVLASMIYKFFDKKNFGGASKNQNI